MNLKPLSIYYIYICICGGMCQALSHVQCFVTPWTVAHQTPLSVGFFQARMLEWVDVLHPRGGGSSLPLPQCGICRVASTEEYSVGKRERIDQHHLSQLGTLDNDTVTSHCSTSTGYGMTKMALYLWGVPPPNPQFQCNPVIPRKMRQIPTEGCSTNL